MPLAALSLIILAQGPVKENNPILPSVEYKEIEVREVLRKTFQAAGIPLDQLVIGPEVQGIVSFALVNQRFEMFLHCIARQVDCVAPLRDGKYVMFHRSKWPSKKAINFSFNRALPSKILRIVFDEAKVPYQIEGNPTLDRPITFEACGQIEFVVDELVSRVRCRYRVDKGVYIIF